MKKKSNLKRFIKYFKPYKLMFILDLIAASIMSIISILYPILTRLIFNNFVNKGENGMVPIVICGVSLFVVYVIRMLLEYFVTYFGHGVGVNIQKDMRKELFTKYEDMPFSYYDEHEVGEMMSRITNDLKDISELAHHGPENFLVCGITIIGSFIYLLTINYVLALLLFAIVPILIFISVFLNKKMFNASVESNKNIANINAKIESSLSGIRVTRAFNNKQIELDKFNLSNKEYVKSRMHAYKYMGLFKSTSTFIMDIFNVVCIVAGALLVIYTKIFNLGDYLAFAVSISLFTNPIDTLVKFTEQFEDGSAGFHRYIEIIDTPIKSQKENVIKKINLNGNIEFRHVNFSYLTSNGILNNVSFKVNQGDKVAFVGSSGGGKTTICHLIPNFYEVNDNHIFFDNIDINDISYDALRENLGIVEQDVFLFNDTIKNNIRYAKLDASDEEIIEAAKKADIYDFIYSLPKGFDTIVGERGIKLSGGQKQRISIARVFLKNPSILILDEATSALDNITEAEIQKSLDKLSKGRTTIIVAHRLSTIKKVNKIFVIESGSIIEEGSHIELLKHNGRYKELYDNQFNIEKGENNI